MLADDPDKVHVNFETAAGVVLGAGRYSRYGTLRAAAAALLPTGSAQHYLRAAQVVDDADQQLWAIAGPRAQEIAFVVVSVPAPPPSLHFFRCNTAVTSSAPEACRVFRARRTMWRAAAGATAS
jgi:hypothetical protein